MMAALAIAASEIAARQSTTFDAVMRLAHTYVTTYEDHQLSTVIAREQYHQQLLDSEATVKSERTLLSDYVILQLPDEDWVAVRDTYSADGAPVGERGARLKALFSGPRDQWGDRAMEMAAESAKFNLGELYYRTVNLPTFALRFLRPASRKRVEFNKAGEEAVDNTTSWVIAFRETKGPTFTGTPEGRDIQANGRFWIAPDSGVVLKSEMILGGTRRVSARATITVTYGSDPSLGFRIPIEMRERYDNPRRQQADVVIAVATYSDFRRRTGAVPPASVK
jgi:hypothetical protein